MKIPPAFLEPFPFAVITLIRFRGYDLSPSYCQTPLKIYKTNQKFRICTIENKLFYS
jgi:hypothetical protein